MIQSLSKPSMSLPPQARPTRRLRQSAALRALASLKLAVVLMGAIGVAMATATVYEARHTRAEAQMLFYQSSWFGVLLVLLALNILAATVIRWPFPPRRIGFPITHLGILVILAGALITNRLGVEGQLRLGERTSSDSLSLANWIVRVEAGEGEHARSVDVPIPMDALRPSRGRGSAVAIGDSGLVLTFQEFFPNSRWEGRGAADASSAVVRAAPRNDEQVEEPALCVDAKVGSNSQKVWLSSERMARVSVGGQVFRLSLDHARLQLPFSVQLDRFERETYPGTDQAAMFASHVTLSGEGIAGQPQFTIRMNQPLKYGGYTFFQSGFDRNPMRTTSILTVSRDPGKWTVYCGFCLVCIGVFLMVVAKRRTGAKQSVEAFQLDPVGKLLKEGRALCAV